MRQDVLAVMVVLLMLVLAALVGPIEMVGSVLALGIVLVYGAVLQVLRHRPTSGEGTATLLVTALATLAVPILGALVFLWSLAVGQPFFQSLGLWGAIILAGASLGQIARRFEQRQEPVAAGSPAPLA